MLFNSFEFLVFLPIVFVLYWFVFRKREWQNLLIVTASYVFYGWWDWRFLFLIAFTSLCSFFSGILIELIERGIRPPLAPPTQEGKRRRKQRIVCAVNLIVNFLILGVFKYYNFFADSLAQLVWGLFHYQLDWVTLNVILPVGISFYTFQALSYTIDVYRKDVPVTRNVVEFCAFISFFPQLVAGPIERATNLLPQFAKPRTFDYAQAVDGMRQILWGLFKKIAVADNCAAYVDYVYGSYASQSGSTLAIAAVLFAFQIYGEFSGYSDIAIGTSKLFGIRLMRNFNNPYFSRDIAEFWRRWHISLTTWFRDYVYIPLGGSRVPKAKVVRNTFVIFLLSGFWHGANWTFLAWGAFHALLFLPLILSGRNRKYTCGIAEGRALPTWSEAGRMLLTFALVTVGWILFRADSIGKAWQYLTLLPGGGAPYTEGLAACSVFVLLMLVMEWVHRAGNHGLDLRIHSAAIRYLLYYSLIVIMFFAYSNSETFIYFQF